MSGGGSFAKVEQQTMVQEAWGWQRLACWRRREEAGEAHVQEAGGRWGRRPGGRS